MAIGIRMRRPGPEDLQALVDQSRGAAVTYEPLGMTASGLAPSGYHLDRRVRRLGADSDIFRAATEAIRGWQVHRGAGLVVCVDGPPAEGQVVAMSAPLPLGYVDAVCRVVATTEQDDRFGFVYGTLPAHPASGEESFMVGRDPDGTVSFEITAISRPRHPLSRLAPPVARRLQRSATERYFEAMRRAVSR